MMNRWSVYSFWCLLGIMAWGCAQNAKYVWVDDLPPSLLRPEAYRINPGDVLSISVWNQSKLSVDSKVRQDGQVTLPLIGDVSVAGLTPAGAGKQIERRLNGLVVDPKVNVSLREGVVPTYSVVGQVKTSGAYPITGPITVLQAIAAAGGLNEFANKNQIYVIRKHPELVRIRFTYNKLQRAEGRAALFQLRDGDVVVVE